MKEDIQGKTALHEAAKQGAIETVKHLLDKGVDVNAPDSDGRTPLHWATLNGNIGIVRMLLEAGAKSDYIVVRWDGEGKNEIVDLVIEYGGNL